MTTTSVAVDPNLAREAGFVVPVVLTPAAWNEAVAWSDADTDETGAVGQSETGRLWDVLHMARRATGPTHRFAGVTCKDFTVLRVPREVPYAGDSDDDELAEDYRSLMPVWMVAIVGGTPTTVTISLDHE